MNHKSNLKLIHYIVILVGVIHYSSQGCNDVYECQNGYCYNRVPTTVCTNLINYAETINRYRHVSRLRIYNSNIYEVQPGAFGYLNSLQHLWMPNNNITLLEPGSLNGLLNLAELNLTNNNIETISKGVFNGMHALSLLDLSYNKIQTIANNSFTGTNGLKTLYLNGNQISDMSGLTGDCKSLEVLDLSNNNLEELHFAQSCKMLRILNVTSNNLISFTGDELSSNIASLDLSHNNLSYIKRTDLSNLNELIQLNLSRNPLFEERDMPLDLFQDRALLQALNLSATSIKKLSVGVFSQLRSLGVLDLSSNNLTYLPNAIFHDLESLRELYLGDNRLSYFQYDGPALRKVDLNANLWNCDSLSSAIKKLKSVEVLRGSSYNTTNVYGISCYEEIKDFGKVDTYNFSDISDLQKEYLSHLIRTQIDLRETFAQLKTFLEQSGQSRSNISTNERMEVTLRDLKDILNKTGVHLESFGNTIKQQQFDEENLLVNLTGALALLPKLVIKQQQFDEENLLTNLTIVLGSLPKLADVLANIKNETDFRGAPEANDDNAIKQLIMELKDIILKLNNNFVSSNTDASIKSLQTMQIEASKTSSSSTANKSDTIALYCIVFILLAIFGLLFIKQHRRLKNSRSIRDESNPLNSLVV